MNKTLISIAALLALAAVPSLSQAEEAAAPAASPITYNLGVVTDYRYRGMSQTRLMPALQGGMDYAGANGLYLGAWGSTIKWIKDSGGDGNLEIDLYGGWKGEVAKGLTLDVGVLAYQYPGNKLAVSANTNEIYAALTYDVATLKYSHSVSNLFGFADSKGSGYLDLSATFDVSGYSVTPHIGKQTVKNTSGASYTDYSLTVSKDFNGLVPSIAIVSTDLDVSLGGKNIGKTGVVLGLKKNF